MKRLIAVAENVSEDVNEDVAKARDDKAVLRNILRL